MARLHSAGGLVRGRGRVVDGRYIGDTAPSSRVALGGMFVDPAQLPSDLKEPSMEAGQPPRISRPGAGPLLSSLAAALTACEQAGLKPKLRHGGIIETRHGYVVRAGRAWVARTAAWTEFTPEGDDHDDG